MKSMLLAAAGVVALTALFASPTAARDFASSSRFVGQAANACGSFASDGHHRRSACNSDVIMDVYGGEWARYNNHSWDSDSYNDWWHDRPDRAYPAWMRRNQDCQRPWFAGDTLRC